VQIELIYDCIQCSYLLQYYYCRSDKSV